MFSDEDNSDQERLEKQRRNLASFCADAAAEEAVTAVIAGEAEDDNPDQLSEEAELQRLRNSERYVQYASRKKRDAARVPVVAKRPRSLDRDLEDRDCVRHDYASAKGSHNLEEDPHPQSPQGNLEHPATMRSSSSKPNRFKLLERPKKEGPLIDPKIIDDSSDDDSASDGSSSDAPLGPSVPGESSPWDAGHPLDTAPVQNQATLGASHDSHVTCIAIDRAGNRFLTGSLDSTVKLWDFNAMNKSMQPFRSVRPLNEAPIQMMQCAPTGGLLLCAGGGNTTVVMDREGRVVSETAKGDMYIVDMAQTKGHTGNVLSAKWRPGEQWDGKVIGTTAADTTIRLWDVTRISKKPMVDNPIVSQQKVIKLRSAKGGRVSATAMDWTRDGKSCLVACSDGRIRMVNPDAYSMRPVDESDVVLRPGTEATSIITSPQTCPSPLVLVRSTDDYLRVFDYRKLKTPMKEFSDLPNAVAETNACFVGDGAEYFATGTSANRKKSGMRGSLRLFETKTLRHVWKSDTEETIGSVVFTLWHRSINQIMYGCADGKVRILYHQRESRRGVLSCLARSDFRKADGVASVGVGEAMPASAIYERYAGRSKHHTTAEGSSTENQMVSKRRRREISEAMKPKPFTGPGALQQKSSVSLAKHLSASEVNQEWSRDPREAILRYAEVAKKDPIFTTAYKSTQPETLLAEKTAEQEEEDTRKAIYERDRLRQARNKTETG